MSMGINANSSYGAGTGYNSTGSYMAKNNAFPVRRQERQLSLRVK